MKKALTGTRDRRFVKHVGEHYAELQFFADELGRPQAYLVMVPNWQTEMSEGKSAFDRQDERVIRYEGERAVQALNAAHLSGWRRMK